MVDALEERFIKEADLVECFLVDRPVAEDAAVAIGGVSDAINEASKLLREVVGWFDRRELPLLGGRAGDLIDAIRLRGEGSGDPFPHLFVGVAPPLLVLIARVAGDGMQPAGGALLARSGPIR
ncbi:MAG: hypothetical protein J0H25_01100 [Rhizobiales bacterium]|nr:hypothetical protein [Hyphomicrobiales bacterium]